MKRNQHEVIDRILDLLTELVDDTPAEKQTETKPMEMLTIKECTKAVRGVSEHTIRKLVAQGRVRYIRTGEGKRGKILISKQSLLDYLCGADNRSK
ncbi:MAG: helix-turn-helix domain-containing protein [Oscillospiraceae bacterium]|nr:helix-turn-helix domain-containing protein [Oscillospiraceae bacterium]